MSINTESTHYRKTDVADRANRQKIKAFRRIKKMSEDESDPLTAMMASYLLIKLAQPIREEPDYA